MLHIVPDAATSGFPPVPDHEKCLRCHRKLVNPKWRRLGYGPACHERARYAQVMAEVRDDLGIPPRGKRAAPIPAAAQVALDLPVK